MIAEYPTETVTFANVDPYQLRSGYLKEIPNIVTWPTVQNTLQLGQSLHDAILIGGDSTVPGIFSFVDPSMVPPSGTSTQQIQFVPDDTISFTTPTHTVSVTVVNAIIPTILSWPTPMNSINVGQPVEDAGLIGGTSVVVGTFTYVTPLGTPPTGISLQQIVFTPGDTTLYEVVYNSVDITVNKTIPTVTWPFPSTPIAVGQQVQMASLIRGSASVPGTFSYITPTATPSVGPSVQQIMFESDDSAMYEARYSTVNVIVLKATPDISTWPTVAYVYPCSRLLESMELSGGTASVPGTFSFADPTNEPPNGTTQQVVVFTPTDTVNYDSVTGSISVTTYCRPCDNDRGKPNAYGADHESIRVRKRIDACACCRGGYAGQAPAVVERCTKCDIMTSSQPPPRYAYSEHQRMMRELVACPLYEKTYTLDIVCEDIIDASTPSETVPPSVAILNSQNPYVRYEYRTYDRISGIEEIADTVRGISSSEVTARRRRIQEVSAKRSQRRHAEHFRVTPPAPPCRVPQVGPQPGVPIAPVTPCNPGTQRVDYSIPNK